MPSAQLLARISDRRDSSPASYLGRGSSGWHQTQGGSWPAFPRSLKSSTHLPQGKGRFLRAGQALATCPLARHNVQTHPRSKHRNISSIPGGFPLPCGLGCRSHSSGPSPALTSSCGCCGCCGCSSAITW